MERNPGDAHAIPDHIYERFAELLKVRIEKGVFTTEDSVRYTFFAVLLDKGQFKPEDFVLELPHNRITGAEVDTFISDYEKQQIVIEFKYHRSIPSGKNSPRPNKTGQLFNDIRRLLEFRLEKQGIRLLVYLTDSEMSAYMKKESNGLKEFFDMEKSEEINLSLTFFNERCKTFCDAAGGSFSAKLRCELNNKLPKGHDLRIYQVFPHTGI
ncbi:MAG TPA: hypothetical protein ENO22_09010 [candidate division Zixibacteria bacterium]|nr:hypothetical protein [candidate division Zixibacteria bacterium]